MTTPTLRSVELFGGAGGLSLGTEASGFRPEMFVEWDKFACETFRQNQTDGSTGVQGIPVFEGDIREVDWSHIRPGLDLVSGGPPCQPFSMSGKSLAADDKRDMFPAASDAIRVLKPRGFILENVKGLTRSTFANYFQLILLRLQYPEMQAFQDEAWIDHLQRLQSEHTSTRDHGLSYNVTANLANAADYGVPQQRHRVFLVGYRNDVSAEWSFPEPTHSHDALLKSQWVTGEYWDEHEIAEKDRPEKPGRFSSRIEAIRVGKREVSEERWRTVRDALKGMPEPELEGVAGWRNHKLQLGAKSYTGHTGSPLDLPAKAIRAGVNGNPGGTNMLVRVDGTVRYFSVREAARIQTFPDDYEFHGSWGQNIRQLGNAVPVKLAEVVASSVADHLIGAGFRDKDLPQVLTA